MSHPPSRWLATTIKAGSRAIVVRIAEAKGSTPRDCDAFMMVNHSATCGTIGGGVLEWTAIEHARDMIARGDTTARLSLPLGPYLGQCCGGHVTLEFFQGDLRFARRLEARERQECAGYQKLIVIGAGHVGKAIAQAFKPLPFAVTVLDTRAEEIAHLPFGVRGEVIDDPARSIDAAPPGSSFLILTHSHTMDFLAAEAALKRIDARYVGMIGSATKLSKFRSWLRARGEGDMLMERLVCPIGGDLVRDKRPEIIAALVAAELIVRFRRDADVVDKPIASFADRPFAMQC